MDILWQADTDCPHLCPGSTVVRDLTELYALAEAEKIRNFANVSGELPDNPKFDFSAIEASLKCHNGCYVVLVPHADGWMKICHNFQGVPKVVTITQSVTLAQDTKF